MLPPFKTCYLSLYSKSCQKLVSKADRLACDGYNWVTSVLMFLQLWTRQSMNINEYICKSNEWCESFTAYATSRMIFVILFEIIVTKKNTWFNAQQNWSSRAVSLILNVAILFECISISSKNFILIKNILSNFEISDLEVVYIYGSSLHFYLL